MLPNILDEATSTTRLLAVKYKEPANCPNLTSATLPVHPRQDVNRCAFARRLACLDPVNIVTSSTQTASQFEPVIDHLVKHQHLEGCSCDEQIRQYDEFVYNVVSPNLPVFKEFDFHKQRLAEFLQQHE